MADFAPGGPGGMDGDVDLEDLLSQMFMGGMGGGGGFHGMGGMPGMGGMHGMPGMGRGPKRKQRGKDMVQQYEVTLEELYKGKTVKLASTRNVLCSNCKGYHPPFSFPSTLQSLTKLPPAPAAKTKPSQKNAPPVKAAVGLKTSAKSAAAS